MSVSQSVCHSAISSETAVPISTKLCRYVPYGPGMPQFFFHQNISIPDGLKRAEAAAGGLSEKVLESGMLRGPPGHRRR